MYPISTMIPISINIWLVDLKIAQAPSTNTPYGRSVRVLSLCGNYYSSLSISESIKFKTVALLLHIEPAFGLITFQIEVGSTSYIASEYIILQYTSWKNNNWFGFTSMVLEYNYAYINHRILLTNNTQYIRDQFSI